MVPPRRLLLDTHVFIWWRAEPAKISPEARAAIAEADLVFVSAASAWEIAIKAGLGRIELPGSVEQGVLDSGFERLAVTFPHAEGVTGLPFLQRDPFDRLLVAQSRAEGLTLVTHDRTLEGYGVPILWA